jgi:YD repeat-containing protein
VLWHDVLANYPCRKAVFWEGIETSSPDETSTFSMHRAVSDTTVTYDQSTFTGAEGGVTTTWFYPHTYQSSASPGNWQAGLVYRVDEPDGSTVQRTWAQNPPPGTKAARQDCPACGEWFPYDSLNPYVQIELRSVVTAGVTETAQTSYRHDRNGNELSREERDWSPGSALIRRTTRTYLHGTEDAATYPPTDEGNVYWNSAAPALLSLEASSQVDGPQSPPARRENCFDAHGNVTIQARLLSGGGGSLVNCATGAVAANAIASKFSYNEHGQPLVAIDARGVSTKLEYDANSLYLMRKTEACNQSLDANVPCTLAERRTTYW